MSNHAPGSPAGTRSPAAVDAPADRGRWIAFAAVLTVQLAQGTVNTVLVAALKIVSGDLHSSETVLSWTVTAPFLASAIANLTS